MVGVPPERVMLDGGQWTAARDGWSVSVTSIAEPLKDTHQEPCTASSHCGHRRMPYSALQFICISLVLILAFFKQPSTVLLGLVCRVDAKEALGP